MTSQGTAIAWPLRALVGGGGAFWRGGCAGDWTRARRHQDKLRLADPACGDGRGAWRDSTLPLPRYFCSPCSPNAGK